MPKFNAPARIRQLRRNHFSGLSGLPEPARAYVFPKAWVARTIDNSGQSGESGPSYRHQQEFSQVWEQDAFTNPNDPWKRRVVAQVARDGVWLEVNTEGLSWLDARQLASLAVGNFRFTAPKVSGYTLRTWGDIPLPPDVVVWRLPTATYDRTALERLGRDFAQAFPGLAGNTSQGRQLDKVPVVSLEVDPGSGETILAARGGDLRQGITDMGADLVDRLWRAFVQSWLTQNASWARASDFGLSDLYTPPAPPTIQPVTGPVISTGNGAGGPQAGTDWSKLSSDGRPVNTVGQNLLLGAPTFLYPTIEDTYSMPLLSLVEPPAKPAPKKSGLGTVVKVAAGVAAGFAVLKLLTRKKKR